MKNDFDKIAKSIREASYVKVGILGLHSAREGHSNNADIGMKHEFGLAGMPVRSFLRFPLETYLRKKVSVLKFDKRMSIKDMLYLIGAVAREVIEEAFETEGYGQWKRTKTVGETLVDTGQLKKSISFEVV